MKFVTQKMVIVTIKKCILVRSQYKVPTVRSVSVLTMREDLFGTDHALVMVTGRVHQIFFLELINRSTAKQSRKSIPKDLKK